ncbi:MAG TPA: hypothetical protein VE964_17035 [Myxococcales bacterium]|nr:hypothetical protein [Myxococcales bacterium]
MSTFGLEEEDLQDPYGVAGDLPGVTPAPPELPPALPPGQSDLGPAAQMMGMTPDVAPVAPPAAAPPAAALPPASPVAPGSGPDAALETRLEPLPPPPARPKITGNPEVDKANALDWANRLTDYEGKVGAHKALLEQIKAQTAASGTEREAKATEDFERSDAKLRSEFAPERARRQATIDSRTAEHAAAEQDLTKGYWEGKGTGDRVMAALMISIGALGQGMQNAAAAKLGQVGQAKNHGLEALDRLMEDDYKRKQAKVAAAKDSILEARYGMESAEANHRAAVNDNDALFAARWKTIAATTKAELARRGLSDAEINENETYLHALQKSADYNEKIHERDVDRIMKEKHDEKMLARQLRAGSHSNDLAERRLGLQTRRQDTNEAKEWANKNGLYEIKKSQEDLRASMRLLEEHPNDPAIQQQVLDKMIIAARGGGTVTQGAYAQFGKHLGGLQGQFEDRLESGDTGGWGDTSKANVKEALKATYAEMQRLGHEKYDQFQDAFSDSPYYADLERRHFSGMSGYGGNEEGISTHGKTKPKEEPKKPAPMEAGKEPPKEAPKPSFNAAPGADYDWINGEWVLRKKGTK